MSLQEQSVKEANDVSQEGDRGIHTCKHRVVGQCLAQYNHSGCGHWGEGSRGEGKDREEKDGGGGGGGGGGGVNFDKCVVPCTQLGSIATHICWMLN